MLLSEFDYDLPPELIAQEPAPERDASRLLVLDRASGRMEHRIFTDLPEYFRPGDLLVLNDTRVLPARLFGVFASGGSVEILLIRPVAGGCWDALVKPARRAKPGERLILACGHLEVEVTGRGTLGHRVLRLPPDVDLPAILDSYGVMPLPPYIKGRAQSPEPRAEKDQGEVTSLGSRLSALDADRDRYQTVYAREEGAVAAPTAGLHFTHALLDRLRAVGVQVQTITLHVGPGTFQPIRVDDLARHRMEAERYVISEVAAAAVRAAKAEGRRVVAVGTTTVRTLEHAARTGSLRPGSGEADLFIVPGYRFRVVDVFLTNFHLPRSTPLLLVSAFAGLPEVRRAYAEAIRQRYRFYSYGDAMLVL
ncbi:MAG: S-adenosylmethionine:tRNA ribosyltransferase-isomerase [Candidatus Methylomirabilales bacterium]